MSDLNMIARKIHTLEKQVADLRTKERPSYASGFLSDMTMYPGVMGLWPFSSTHNNNVEDVSGQNRTFFSSGAQVHSLIDDRYPYYLFDGSDDYLSRPSIDCDGAFTVGGWFYLDDLTADRYLIAKWGAVGSYSFAIHFSLASLAFKFSVSGTGSDEYTVTSSVPVTAATWYFIAGRFVPLTSIDIFVNAVQDSSLYSIYFPIPASTKNGDIDFTIGVDGAGLNLHKGRAGLSFFYADDMAANQVIYLYQKSRVMFGI